MTTTDLDALEAKAAKAAAAYEAAQQAAAQARQAELDRQHARARKLDEQIVADYSDAAYLEAVDQARQDMAQAFADSDFGKAWIAFQAAKIRHAHAAQTYNSALGALGRYETMAPARPADTASLEVLTTIIDRRSADTVYGELDEQEQARAAYIASTEG